MSREMEILSDISEQHDLRVNSKTNRTFSNAIPFNHSRLKLIFNSASSGQARRKPKVTLAGRQQERGQE